MQVMFLMMQGLSEFIRFARVDAGSTVIDVYPGEGDWTRLFSDIVGPEGRVFSFVPAEVAHFKNDPVGRMQTLAKEPGRDNVEAVSADLVALPEVTQPADVLWLHLFYHDLHTALIQARGATAADFNRAVYERLKPGGFYVIVDHAAAAGAGTSDTQSLHRIDPASVREEVEAPASCWMRKAPCSRTRTIRTRPRCSTPRSRARPIASPIGS
jgi:predicted methyltransferase